jgi:hypothetical protein
MKRVPSYPGGACFPTAADLQPSAIASDRRAVAALITLACLSFAAVVGTLLLEAALSEQRYLSRLELASQGEWLVEAGFSRARAQLAKSPKFSGETWTIPGSALGRTESAVVQIAARSDAANAGRWHVAVQARFSASNEPAIEASRDLAIR